MVRAADSVGANLAEAAGRWHTPDRRRFLLIARGSAYELEHWLLRAHARGLIEDDAGAQLREMHRVIQGLVRRHA